MTGDELDDALQALGRARAEPPGEEFADGLEDRLRALHDRRRRGASPTVRRMAARAMAVAAAVLLVVGVALTVGPGGDPRDDGRLLLASAEGASLVLPDGTVVAAHGGMDLVEGTLVVTSASGSARVDGVEVPPDRVAVVEDGRLRLLDVDRAPSTSAPPTTRPVDGGTPSSAPPTTASAPTTTSTSRPAASTTTTAPPRPPVASIDLSAERRDRRSVALRWSAYPRDDFARYLLVRTVSDADGRPPDPGPSSTAVLSTADPATRTFGDKLPEDAARAAYRVIVLDHRHRVVGTSVVARV